MESKRFPFGGEQKVNIFVSITLKKAYINVTLFPRFNKELLIFGDSPTDLFNFLWATPLEPTT